MDTLQPETSHPLCMFYIFLAWIYLALQYGWVYPSILLVLTLSLTYSVIMPLVVVFGLVYFLLIEFRFKYHVCYIFIPQYEGGKANKCP